MLVAAAGNVDREGLLRRVFDHSYGLGSSFRQFHRVDLTLVDLESILPTLGSPCMYPGFTRVEGRVTSRTERAPCGGQVAVPDLCTWWREAFLGLVSGLSTGVYASRVESPPSSARCVDLLHVDARSPFRLAPVPDSLAPALDKAAQKLARISPGTRLEVLGMNDGALHVQLHRTSAGCGLDMDRMLLRTLERSLPGVPIRDATPRSVLTDSVLDDSLLNEPALDEST